LYKPSIMIVEDDGAVREALKIMLGEKYEIIFATNGEEAVRNYSTYKPEVVLMDVMMPVMDGVEAARKIKKIDPRAKIVGLTAYARKRGKELLEAGALEVLEKPFTRKQLIEVIDKYLAQ